MGEPKATGSPSPDRASDYRLAHALRDGEANALAEIFDAHGPLLYDYCHSLLCDRGAAASAVVDSLIAAQEHVAGLREPERLHGWLYALARKECRHRLDATDRADLPDQSDLTETAFDVDNGENDRTEGDRLIVISAMSALSDRHREVAELAIRHHLDAVDLAGVLALPLPDATHLFADALDELSSAIEAVTIARAGRDDCPSVAALTDDLDWPPASEVCRSIVGHVKSCPVCAAHRPPQTPTGQSLRSLPVATVPAGLRPRLLALGAEPQRHEKRARLARRAGPFDIWGWPTNDPDRPGRIGGRKTVVACAACAVLLAAGAVLLLVPGTEHKAVHGGSPIAEVPAPLPDTGSPGTHPSAATPAPSRSRPSRAPIRILTRPRTPNVRAPVHAPTSPRGKAAFSTSCDGSSDSCAAALSASGGTVRWSATSSRYVSADDSGGTLHNGDTVIILISADTQDACAAAEPVTSGTVAFSPGGSALLSWSC